MQMFKRSKVGKHVISNPGVTVLGKSPLTKKHFTIPNEVISQISCGDAHCVLLCESGRVFTFGNNAYGQCGLNAHPEPYETIKLPTVLKSLNSYQIVQVECGSHCSFFVTSDGELLGCGRNVQGDLGLGHNALCPLPTRIGRSLYVKSVSASGSHFMVIACTNEVLACGDNVHGQLGLGHEEFQTRLAQVRFPEKIVKISCGGAFNAALSASGKAYATNTDVVARGDAEKNVFRIVPGLADVVDVACGHEHSVLLTANGSAWTFGVNSHGQLGKDGVAKSPCPVRCSVPSVIRAFAGAYTSGVITDDGEMYLWGRGLDNVESIKNEPEPKISKKFSNLHVKEAGLCEKFFVFFSQSKTEFELNKGVRLSPVHKLESRVLPTLECAVCCKSMTAPVPMCQRDQHLCGPCKSKVELWPQCRSEFTEAESIALERQCKKFKLSCTLCQDCMPGSAIEAHLLVCPCRQRHCPLKEACGWLGKARDSLEHVTAAHPDLVWRGSPQTFRFSHIAGQPETRAWLVDDVVYILYWKFDEETRELQVTVRQIGDDGSTLEHKLKLEFVDLHNNFQSHVTDIAFDTDPVNDVFTVTSCLKFHISENIQENICRASIVKREELDQLRDQLVASATAQSKRAH